MRKRGQAKRLKFPYAAEQLIKGLSDDYLDLVPELSNSEWGEGEPDILTKESNVLQLSHKVASVGKIMGVPIRINEEIYQQAKMVAAAECRSIPGQIEFWAKLGKCALDNPDLPIEFVKEILISANSDPDLAEPFNFE